MTYIKLLEEFENTQEKRRFIVENIDVILEFLYSLKFKIDRLYEATQAVYDRRNRIIRVYLPVREFLMLGYIPKGKDINQKADILVYLLKELIRIKEDCKNLKEESIDCNAFLKAFHKYV